MEVKRKCANCPPWTQTVCRHAFGRYWDVRSGNGEGCDHPLDDMAEAWRKAGWTPKQKRPALPLPTRLTQREFKLTSLVEKYKKGLRK